jgi:thiamine-monophosphate kinase
MGGTPRFALVSLALARRTSRAWVEQFYTGLVALGRRFDVAVVGGDTAVVASGTLIDVMVAGEVPRGRALVRSGARPGDQLFVSGRLGLAALGLRLLRSRPGLRRFAPSAPRRAVVAGVASQALQAHLYPEPRCALGRFLAERRLASALIDLSDGLSTDLGHLCRASGVGARIWADRIPGPAISESRGRGKSAARAVSPADALELALHGGEDYELLFTVPPRLSAQVPRSFRGLPLRRIGEIRRSKQILLAEPSGATRPLELAGYDHFKGS